MTKSNRHNSHGIRICCITNNHKFLLSTVLSCLPLSQAAVPATPAQPTATLLPARSWPATALRNFGYLAYPAQSYAPYAPFPAAAAPASTLPLTSAYAADPVEPFGAPYASAGYLPWWGAYAAGRQAPGYFYPPGYGYLHPGFGYGYPIQGELLFTV